MAAEDFEIMRMYLRDQLRDAGFIELDNQMSEKVENSLDLTQKQRLITYLYLVRETLSLSSTDAVTRVLSSFGELRSSVRSAKVVGVQVELSGQEATVYGVGAIDLFEAAIDPGILRTVDELIGMLLEDEEP